MLSVVILAILAFYFLTAKNNRLFEQFRSVVARFSLLVHLQLVRHETRSECRVTDVFSTRYKSEVQFLFAYFYVV